MQRIVSLQSETQIYKSILELNIYVLKLAPHLLWYKLPEQCHKEKFIEVIKGVFHEMHILSEFW